MSFQTPIFPSFAIYLIGKNLVGKKLPTNIFSDENFTDEYFLPTNIFCRRIGMHFFVENYKIVLFCNNFSCRSNVLWSRNQIYYEFIACGIQLIKGNNEKKKRNLFKMLLMYLTAIFLRFFISARLVDEDILKSGTRRSKEPTT